MSTSQSLTEFLMPKDPSGLGYPPMFLSSLPCDRTLFRKSVRHIRSTPKWRALRADPRFIEALADVDRTVRKEVCGVQDQGSAASGRPS